MHKKLKSLPVWPEIAQLIRRALREDLGKGDITTKSIVPDRWCGRAAIVARGNYVVSGVGIAQAIFKEMDRSLRCVVKRHDGQRVKAGQAIVTINGKLGSILTAERTALNFMQRMTGIATLTAQFVSRVKPFPVKILDTRKTTPNLRVLEKYAVVCGGGCNHRMGLYDMALIKDNHLVARVRHKLAEAIALIRRKYPGKLIEVEVETEKDLNDALAAGPDWILLDNMSVAQIRRCVRLCAGRASLEASGGISLKNIRAVAGTGVDAISLGCLTHSVCAADLSLEVFN